MQSNVEFPLVQTKVSLKCMVLHKYELSNDPHGCPITRDDTAIWNLRICCVFLRYIQIKFMNNAEAG